MDFDFEFDKITQQFTRRLQSERDRLSEIRAELVKGGMSIQYNRNTEFDQKLAELLAIQIGRFEVIDHVFITSTTTPTNPAEVNLCANSISVPPHDLKVQNSTDVEPLRASKGSSLTISPTGENNRSHRKRSHARPYENMKLVAVIEDGKFSVRMSKIGAITAFPERNCFAVKHGRMITLISPSGDELCTYRMAPDDSPRLRRGTYCPCILARNTANGQFIGIDHGKIKSVEPIELPENASGIVDIQFKERITHPKSRLPKGIAISTSSNRLFSAFGSNIESYSLSTWSYRDTFHVDMSPNTPFEPFVLGVRGNQLFYREDNLHASVFYAVPLDDGGKVATTRWKVVAKNLPKLRGISFDSEGNILTAVCGRNRIEVLASDGSEFLASIIPPSSYDVPFCPQEIAVLSAPANGALFGSLESERGNKSCLSNVVAVTDIQANRIILFAPPPALEDARDKLRSSNFLSFSDY